MLILSIDDSEPTLLLLERSAETMGYRHVRSLAPTSPVEALGGEAPDVAMIGWHLAGKPAGAMVAMIAELYPLSPIVVMSSDHRPVSQRDAMAAGAWFFWRKSSEFDLAQLWPVAFEQRQRLLDGADDPTPDDVLRERYRRELARHDGNFSAAADALGIHRTTLARRLRARPLS